MLKKITLIVLSLFTSVLVANAQNSRANTKKTVPYRADFARIYTGNSSYHAFEIRGGTLWGWGFNVAGQLGDSTTTTKSYPVQIGQENNWSRVVPGVYHSAAIKADGTLWTWGGNNYGQLGDGTKTASLKPKQIGSDSNWVSLTTSYHHTLAIKSDGTLWAWGDNANGTFGNGSTTSSDTPIQIGSDADWVSVSTSNTHTLALKSDGTLWAWGSNTRGQVGDGTSTARTSPVQVGSSNKWSFVAVGMEHSMGIMADGSLWTWGNNYVGQLGTGNNQNKNVPTRIGTDNNWVAVCGGSAHTLALKSDGNLWSWGTSQLGQLGDGTNNDKSSPTAIGSDSKWVSISAAFNSSFGLKSDGNLYYWGHNSTYTLGDSSNTNRLTPTKRKAIATKWLSISAGKNHAIGIKTDGTLHAWGNNDSAQLGDSSNISKSGIVKIDIDQKWIAASAGGKHSLALKSDGTLWAWGDNTYHQLGDSSSVQRIKPKAINQSKDWVSIAAGTNHSLAIRANGTLWAWGNNAEGQLGDGTNNNIKKPAKIGNDNDWMSIAAGDQHSLALKADGTLWAWGNNANQQLGDGSTNNSNSPVQVGTDNQWIKMSAGSVYSAAIKSDGTLWAWGNNNSGQLGDGTNNSYSVPTQIGSDKDWIQISCGDSQTWARKTNGTIWSAGNNIYGALGDGSNTNQNQLTQIGTDNNWVNAMAGGNFSIGFKTPADEFCATGYNASGQLGNGSVIDQNIMDCNNCNTPPDPQNSTNATKLNVCSGSNTVLSGMGNGSLSWYDDAVGGNYIGNGATYTTPNLNSNTKFYLQDSACNGKTKRLSIEVKINPAPAATVGNNTSLCKNDSITLGATAQTGNTYIWTSDTGNFNSTLANPKVSPLYTTRYYLTETSSVGCPKTDSVLITVMQPPAVNITSNKTICEGDSVYIGDNAVSGYQYSWSSNTGNFTNSTANPQVTPINTTTYYLTVSNGACNSTDSVTIQVNAAPNATTGNTSTICAGDSVSLGANTVTGNSYMWSSTPSGFSSNVANPKVSPTINTTYQLTETIISTGCSKTNSITITVNPLPLALVGNAQSACSGSTVNLGSTATNGNTYIWSSNPSGFQSTSSKPMVIAQTTTTYIMTESITATGCSKTDSVTIQVKALPNVATKLVVNTLSSLQGGAAYQWVDCKNAYAVISGETNQNFTPKANGEYAVIVILNGCSDTSACTQISSIGIENTWEENTSIDIYPNPNKGTFTVQSAVDGWYILTNELGQVIRYIYLNSQNNRTIHLNEMSTGIYYITGYGSEHTVSRKIVITK